MKIEPREQSYKKMRNILINKNRDYKKMKSKILLMALAILSIVTLESMEEKLITRKVGADTNASNLCPLGLSRDITINLELKCNY